MENLSRQTLQKIKQVRKTLFKTIEISQRDGMGREEGGGFRMGNTCKKKKEKKRKVIPSFCC